VKRSQTPGTYIVYFGGRLIDRRHVGVCTDAHIGGVADIEHITERGTTLQAEVCLADPALEFGATYNLLALGQPHRLGEHRRIRNIRDLVEQRNLCDGLGYG
jgi:hypothetical protein